MCRALEFFLINSQTEPSIYTQRGGGNFSRPSSALCVKTTQKVEQHTIVNAINSSYIGLDDWIFFQVAHECVEMQHRKCHRML